jgi:hypothetical protein
MSKRILHKMGKEKCYIGYPEHGLLSEQLLLACKEILCENPYNFEINNLDNSLIEERTEQKIVLDLIKDASYGIYDISYQKDESGNWGIPSNTFMKIGMAIAFNQKFLFVRNTKKKDFLLPEILQGLDIPIIEFSGVETLKDGLQRDFQKISSVSEKKYSYEQCNFEHRACEYAERHPRLHYPGQPDSKIRTIIVDSDEKDDFRPIVDLTLKMQDKIQYEYFEKAAQKYDNLIRLCALCHAVRSSYIHIFRVTDQTPAEVYIALGISFSLTKLPYSIPRLIFLDTENSKPSLLEGYKNIVRAETIKERKKLLNTFVARALTTITTINLRAENFEFIDIDKKLSLSLDARSLLEFVVASLNRFKENYKEYFFEQANKIAVQDIRDQLLGFLTGSLSLIESQEIKVSIINYDYPLAFDILSTNEHCSVKVVFSWLETNESTTFKNSEECILLFKSAYNKFSGDEINNKRIVEIKVREFEREGGGGEEEEEEEEEETRTESNQELDAEEKE